VKKIYYIVPAGKLTDLVGKSGITQKNPIDLRFSSDKKMAIIKHPADEPKPQVLTDFEKATGVPLTQYSEDEIRIKMSEAIWIIQHPLLPRKEAPKTFGAAIAKHGWKVAAAAGAAAVVGYLAYHFMPG
jgi:hypothetical protein